MNVAPNYPDVIPLRPDAVSDDATGETPEPPDSLTERGTAVWQELAPLYPSLQRRDHVEFAAFCESVAEYREASEMIDEAGIVIIDPSTGLPEPSPLLTIRTAADGRIARWANRFRG